jgi:hypothetical protein
MSCWVYVILHWVAFASTVEGMTLDRERWRVHHAPCAKLGNTHSAASVVFAMAQCTCEMFFECRALSKHDIHFAMQAIV